MEGFVAPEGAIGPVARHDGAGEVGPRLHLDAGARGRRADRADPAGGMGEHRHEAHARARGAFHQRVLLGPAVGMREGAARARGRGRGARLDLAPHQRRAVEAKPLAVVLGPAPGHGAEVAGRELGVAVDAHGRDLVRAGGRGSGREEGERDQGGGRDAERPKMRSTDESCLVDHTPVIGPPPGVQAIPAPSMDAFRKRRKPPGALLASPAGAWMGGFSDEPGQGGRGRGYARALRR